MIQGTALRFGCIGRAYRQSPWAFDQRNFHLVAAPSVTTETEVADHVEYTLRLPPDVRR